MIRGAVREAGDRAKVAVFSRERDVDRSACVGMKGTRVQSIIRELRGERSTSSSGRVRLRLSPTPWARPR
jgi:hypothetical protein